MKTREVGAEVGAQIGQHIARFFVKESIGWFYAEEGHIARVTECDALYTRKSARVRPVRPRNPSRTDRNVRPMRCDRF